MKKGNFYVKEGLDETIILHTDGSGVENRIWCVGYLKRDLSYRMREYDGFYNLEDLKKIKD